MLEALMNPGAMAREQWMILAILVFIVIGIAYFVYRTWVVIRESATKKYKPNIGLSRIQEQQPSEKAGKAPPKDDKQDGDAS